MSLLSSAALPCGCELVVVKTRILQYKASFLGMGGKWGHRIQPFFALL